MLEVEVLWQSVRTLPENRHRVPVVGWYLQQGATVLEYGIVSRGEAEAARREYLESSIPEIS